MQSQKKRDEFTVSIRRKQINQRMEAMRSILHSSNEINYEKYLPVANQIQNGEKQVKDCMQQLKILSYNAEGAKALFKVLAHHKLYEYLEKNAATLTTMEYNDIITILINLCVHVQLDIPNTAMQIIVTCIVKPEKQMISIWFVANIIYQKSVYSATLASELVQKCDAVQFMQKRIKQKFQNEGEIVIFNFFCCSFLTVSSYLPDKQVKSIFKVIEDILKFQDKYEQNFWFLSEALADHGQHIEASEYEIFNTEINKKFEACCKSKKTKYVKNYLKMLIGFTAADKLAYEKMLKYQIFKSLDFCMENRFPEVKKLCSQIGLNLLSNVGDKVDIDNITFFSQLVLQLTNLQKYPIEVQISIVKYASKFFQISAPQLCVTPQSKQKFIDELLSSNTIGVLATLLLNSNGNVELISQVSFLLTIFVKIEENKKIIIKCREEKIPEFLEQINTQNQTLYQQISNFLKFFN